MINEVMNWDSADLEVFPIEQGQRGVTDLRLLPLPAVLLREERWILLELIQLPERVLQGEGQVLALMGQRVLGAVEGQAGGGERQRGPWGGLGRGRPSTSLAPLWKNTQTRARRNLMFCGKRTETVWISAQSKDVQWGFY